MSSSTFVSPRAYQAPGGIPRRLLGGVMIVVVLVAMVVYWIASGKRDAPRASDAHRPIEARIVESQARGSSHSVDEAADRAVAEARRASASTVAASTASASTVAASTVAASSVAASYVAAATATKATASDSPATNHLPGLPATLEQPVDSAGSRPSDGRVAETNPASHPDPGASAREMDVRSAETRIFDEPDARMEEGGISAARGIGSLTWPGPAALAFPTDVPGRAAPLPADPGSIAPLVGEAVRRVSAPANRDLSQREDAWQERSAQEGATSPLVARPPAGAWVIEEGTVIPAVLTRRIDSDTPGVITAMVSIDVYDTRTAKALLLPKGSRLVGRYNDDVSTGQERLQCAFTRLVLPDGSSFDLPGANGSDALGQAGLPADVDRHFLQRFGAALLIGVIADHVVSPRAVPSTNAYGGGLSATGQVLVNTADAELHRNESIAPTLTVPEGARLNVEVVRDMVFSQPIPGHS